MGESARPSETDFKLTASSNDNIYEMLGFSAKALRGDAPTRQPGFFLDGEPVLHKSSCGIFLGMNSASPDMQCFLHNVQPAFSLCDDWK